MSTYDDFMAKGGEEATPNLPAEQQRVVPPTTNGPAADDRITTATEFNKLIDKSLKVKEEIMDVKLPEPDADNFGVVVRAKNTASGDVLGTATKVQENLLRQQQSDDFTDMIRDLAEFQKAHPRYVAKNKGPHLEADREREQELRASAVTRSDEDG